MAQLSEIADDKNALMLFLHIQPVQPLLLDGSASMMQ